MALTKEQIQNVELDRLEHELENCQHYLNGLRNKHRPSYIKLVETLEDLLVSVRRLDGF